MSDDDLSEYIPTYGDRIAVKDYCRRKTAVADKKSTLLARMREKLAQGQRDMRNNDEGACSAKRPAQCRSGNSYAAKSERRIELSLLHVGPGNEIRQVRSKTGGGTRHMTVSKTMKMTELAQMGINLYFPNGQSPRGRANDFFISIKDYKMGDVDDFMTVGDLYETTKMRLLKFFIVTHNKIEVNSVSPTSSVLVSDDSDDDFLPDLHIGISVSMTSFFWNQRNDLLLIF